jgi:hypothetical protein
MIPNNVDEEIYKDILPLMDLFGGEDGGAAFAKFRYSFLPEVYSSDKADAVAFRRVMKIMSAAAKNMLK